MAQVGFAQPTQETVNAAGSLQINEHTAPADAQGRYAVIVRFEEDSLAAYRGGQPGLAATNPGVRGERKLDVNTPAAQNYLNFLSQRQAQHLSAMSASVGRELAPQAQYLNVLNAATVRLTLDEAAKLQEQQYIRAMWLDELYEMDTDRGPEFIGATSIWNGDTTDGIPYRGEGVVVGIIDSGANMDHPSFAQVAPGDGYVHINPNGDGVFLGACAAPGPTAVCNNKLIGAYDFHPTALGPEDNAGHGSHTASTAAGNPVTADFNGVMVPISGVAPRANIIVYKVCEPTCPTTSSVQAVNQGISDGVDVFNFSISGSDSPWNSAVDLAFLDAFAAGVYSSASAGNAGPGASTVAHTGPWNATVANSTHDRVFGFSLDLTAPAGAPANTQDVTVTPGGAPINNTTVTDVPIIQSPTFADGTNDGCVAFPPDTFRRPATPGGTPAIAIISLDAATSACLSGVRRTNALNAGAFGVIYVDEQFLNLGASGTSWAMTTATWNNIAAAIVGNENIATVTITAPLGARTGGAGDVMNSSSSRGPSQFDLIKPDISAPGTNILAAYIDSVSNGFNAISGTSMSSPHSAGSAALLIGKHPTWNPAEIKSAIAMTARGPQMLKEDGITPSDPFDRGSGRVSLDRAGVISAVMSETLTNFQNADPGMGGDPRTLNLPSFMDRACIDSCSFTRTITSVLPGSVDYTVLTSSVPGVTIQVTPNAFTLAAAGSSQVLTVDVTVDTDVAPAGIWTFGNISLVPSMGGGGTTPQSFTATPALAIPDNLYRGGFGPATMACSTIDTSALAPGSTVSNVNVSIAESHTWVGDTVIKLQTPTGTIMGLLSRPGTVEADDTGVGGAFGDSSNLLLSSPLTYIDGAANDAENLGNGATLPDAGVICQDDTRCNFFPNRGAIAGVANFAALAGESSVGNWTLCIGDRAAGDTGTFQSWTLNFDSTAPRAEGGPIVLPSLDMPVAINPALGAPAITVAPPSSSATLDQGASTTDTITIGNIGGNDLLWNVQSDPPRGTLRTGAATPIATSPPGAGVDLLGLQTNQSKFDAGTSSTPVLTGPPGAITLTHSVSQTLAGGTIACAGGTPQTTRANEYLRTFTLADFGIVDDFNVSQVTFGIENLTVNASATVNLYTLTGPFIRANMTLIGTATQAFTPQALTIVNVPVNATVPAGSTLVAEIATPDLTGVGSFFAGSNAGGQTAPSYLSSTACGITEPTDYNNIGGGFPNVHLLINVTGTTGAPIECGVNGPATWATLAPANGTVASGGSQATTLTYDASGLAAGPYSTNLCIASNDPAQPTVVVPVDLTVNAAPVIALSDASISQNANPDTISTRDLGISNVGGLDLTWNVETAEPDSNGPLGGPGPVLWDNGPLVNLPGGGFGGADASAIQSGLGMNLFGFGIQSAAGNRIADQFVVSDPVGWSVNELEFFTYQTGSTTTSTITGVNYRIWDGPPNDPASSVVFGDTTTNVMTATSFTGFYRATTAAPTGNTRPVMSVRASAGFTLPPGTYWVDWAMTGSLASGPWQPPITINGQTTTGDALVFSGTTLLWSPGMDAGSGTQQGAPFILRGLSAANCVSNPTTIPWLSLNPTSGTTTPGNTDNVTLTFDTTGLAPAVYEAQVCVNSNDASRPLISVPVTLSVGVPPTIDVSPTSIDVTVAPDGSDSQSMDIGNLGQIDLIWSIDEADAAPRPSYIYGRPGAGVYQSAVGFDRASGQTPVGSTTPFATPAPTGGAIGSIDEPFDAITNLPGAGWALINNSFDSANALTSWSQGPDTVFPAHQGAPTAYISANFNNTTGANTISNWLISPEIELRNGTEVRFWTRTVAASTFPDRLEARLSTSGSSTNVGTLPTDVGDFGTLALSINPTLAQGGYPEAWTEFVVTVSGLGSPTTGRVALRYFVEDGGPAGNNSNIIGIDTFSVTQPLAAGCDNPSDLPWVSVTPNSGTTAGGATSNTSVDFDATGLAEGTYNGQLCVNSNDPATPRVTVPVSLTVARLPQTITFGPLSDRNLSEGSFMVSATSDSGLTVEFSSTTPLTCSVAGTTVNLLDIGICTVRASQPGDATYLPAADVDQSFEIVAPMVTVAPATVPDAVIDLPYSVTFTASGAGTTAPYTFSVSAGALPSGLSLAATGELTGTPDTLGDFNFTISAQDSTGAGSGGPFIGSQAYSMSVLDTFIFADGFEDAPRAKRIDLNGAGLQLVSLDLVELLAEPAISGERRVAELFVKGARVGIVNARCSDANCEVQVLWRQADAKVASSAWWTLDSNPFEFYVQVGTRYLMEAGRVE